MSYQPLWLRDLLAYSIQAAALVGVGVIMARALRLRVPRVRHAYWQALLVLCVFLPLLQPWRPEVLESSGAAFTNVTMTAAPAPAPAGPSFAEIVLWVVCAGVVLRIVWMALGLGRLWLYRRNAQWMGQAPEAVEEAQRLAPVFPSFFISRQLPTPATFGFFRPAVLFPTRFLQMEPAMQKAIALHELLHVERRDWLWNMFEETVLTLLWFHLPLWWVVRSARLSREQVVDAEAVRRSNARRPYLKALLEMAGQKRLAESLPAPLFLRESQLAERVALMMKEVHMTRTRLTFSVLTAAVTLLISGATLVWAFPLKTSAPQAEASEVSSWAAGTESSLPADPSSHGNSIAAESESGHQKTNTSKGGGIGDVRSAKPIYKEQPKYPRQAKAKHLSGKVILSCVIDAKGNVTKVTEVSKPLGGGLDESAIDAVRNWKYAPATLDGVPIEVKTDVTINFTLAEKSGKTSPNPYAQPDPQPRMNQNSPRSENNSSQPGKINQAELQRQVNEAMKQAKIAQQANSKIDRAKIQEQIDQAMKQLKMTEAVAPKIDQAKINEQIEQAMKQVQISKDAFPKIDQQKLQEQIDQAMKQLKTAEAVSPNIDQAKIQQQVEEAMKQLQKADSPEMRRQYEEAMKQFQKTNTPEMRRQYEEALKQLKMAQMTAPKIDQAKLRQQVEQAMEQAKLAQESAAKTNKAEIRQQVQQAREQALAARKEAEEARKEAEKLREQLKTERMELQKQRQAAKPSPTAEPKPAPAPPKEAAPAPSVPPVPPAPSARPPEAAAVVDGVPEGAVRGVPGGKVTGIQGGQVKGIEGGHVIGVPGGIAGGVITVPQPPKPASQSPKGAVLPAPPLASPVPPSPPRN